ncbi:hypothetical protein SUGI_0792760 [Cryptomeria japonica]|nr:hypothetical protein SUGI_0792760 [Cryptomeria japonica]
MRYAALASVISSLISLKKEVLAQHGIVGRLGTNEIISAVKDHAAISAINEIKIVTFHAINEYGGHVSVPSGDLMD